LDAGELQQWLTPPAEIRLQDGNPIGFQALAASDPLAVGQSFEIPNTILMGWFGEYGNVWGKEFMNWSGNVADLGQLGFDVVQFDNDFYQGSDPDSVKTVFLNLVEDLSGRKALHGMYFMGHGSLHGVGAIASGGIHYTVGPPTWIMYEEIFARTAAYGLGALIIHACHGNESNARPLLLSVNGIWWGCTGIFNPVTSNYHRRIAKHWGYNREEEAYLGGVMVIETFGGEQETEDFEESSYSSP
jgi:hypothetical protein